jgi:hypothetical protein
MAIPDFQTLMLPVLREASTGEVRISEVAERLSFRVARSLQVLRRVWGRVQFEEIGLATSRLRRGISKRVRIESQLATPLEKVRFCRA